MLFIILVIYSTQSYIPHTFSWCGGGMQQLDSWRLGEKKINAAADLTAYPPAATTTSTTLVLNII